jgi:hypothetical protein
MSTRKQRAAIRRAAEKSTSPGATFGEAESRYNALKHGIDAKFQGMFTQSAEDLAQLDAEYRELYNPADALERFLVDTLINSEWRMRRLRCVEADLWVAGSNLYLDKKFDDIDAPGSGDASKTGPRAFDRLQRTLNALERTYYRALKELQRSQAARAKLDSSVFSTAQSEDSKTTSTSSASFRTNSPEPSHEAINPTPAPSFSSPDSAARPADPGRTQREAA